MNNPGYPEIAALATQAGFEPPSPERLADCPDPARLITSLQDENRDAILSELHGVDFML